MEKEEIFYLLWQSFIETEIVTESRDANHKVLYQRSDGWWALRYSQGMDWIAKRTLEELMLEVIRRKRENL